jgi:hypothetical protein
LGHFVSGIDEDVPSLAHEEATINPEIETLCAMWLNASPDRLEFTGRKKMPDRKRQNT